MPTESYLRLSGTLQGPWTQGKRRDTDNMENCGLNATSMLQETEVQYDLL